MFQLTRANTRALRTLADLVPRGPVAEADLGPTADRAIAALRAARRHEGFLARLDARIRTDEAEYLDDPSLPVATRVRLDAALDAHNRLVWAYAHFVAVLAPFVAEAAVSGRPVRCLELASGSGRLALALARHARRRGLAIHVTGSDVSPVAVDAANRLAAADPAADVHFRVLDALTLEGVRPGEFDLVFFVQSAHHFGAGAVARLTAAASRVASTAFIGIDGYRAWWIPAVLAGTAALYPILAHDSLISARKFYCEAELRLIGELAVGRDRLTIGRRWPGWSTWVARPPPGVRA